MFYLMVFLSVLVYSLYAHLGFDGDLKDSKWYLVLGLATILIGESLWLYYIREELDPNRILLKGLVWDAGISISFVLVGYLFHDIRISPILVTGTIVTMVGLFMIKASVG